MRNHLLGYLPVLAVDHCLNDFSSEFRLAIYLSWGDIDFGEKLFILLGKNELLILVGRGYLTFWGQSYF